MTDLIKLGGKGSGSREIAIDEDGNLVGFKKAKSSCSKAIGRPIHPQIRSNDSRGRIIANSVLNVLQNKPELHQMGIKNQGFVISVMINGDSAINKVAADHGDIIAAMQHILDCLPQPRHKWLKALAIASVYFSSGTVAETMRFLGMTSEAMRINDSMKQRVNQILEENQIQLQV